MSAPRRRGSRATLRFVGASLVALLGGACSSTSPPGVDVATVSLVPPAHLASASAAAPQASTSALAAASSDAAPRAAPSHLGDPCDPTADTCGPAERCDTTCVEPEPVFACVTSTVGDVPSGGTCTGEAHCARGSRCVYRSDPLSETGTCVGYCKTDADCPTTQHCVASETYCDSVDGPSIAYRECRPRGK